MTQKFIISSTENNSITLSGRLLDLVTWLVTSVCSRSECTQSTVLYGPTHAEEICGHDHTVNEIFDFLP